MNSTFELNGRSYDALTGAMLGATPRRQPTTTASVDGMVANKTTPNLPAAVVRRAPLQPKHTAAHRPQPTQTLVRRAIKAPSLVGGTPTPKPPVAKPSAVHARQLHATGPAIAKKLSSDMVSPRRAGLAKTTSQHGAVRHFTPMDISAPRPALAATPAPMPKPSQVQHQVAPAPLAPARRQHNVYGAPTRRPATASSLQPSRRPTPAVASASAAPVPMPMPVPTPAPRNNGSHHEQDVFSQALAQATSHEEPAPKVKTHKSRRKAAQAWGFAGTFAVLMALFGFVAFQNRDDIRLQIASAKAGFSAAAPLYKPDGYELSDMKYASGSVASIYQQGNQNFSITQKKSNWDSQTLLENFVANSGKEYKGFQANGRTVYIYGDGNATWVNGGIWYQIKATSELKDEQLVKIAASM